jgi:hypothetical protein
MVLYVWEGTLWWMGGSAPGTPRTIQLTVLTFVRNRKWIHFRDPYGNPTGKIPLRLSAGPFIPNNPGVVVTKLFTCVRLGAG